MMEEGDKELKEYKSIPLEESDEESLCIDEQLKKGKVAESSLKNRIVSSLLFWGSSSCMLLSNRAIAKSFPYSHLVLIYQNTCAVALLLMFQLWCCRLPHMSLRDFFASCSTRIVTMWVPLAFLFVLNIVSSFEALRSITVPAFTVFRNLSSCVTELLSIIISQGVRLSFLGWCALLIIVSGSAIYAWYDAFFSMRGYLWAAIHVASMAIYAITVKHMKTKDVIERKGYAMKPLNSTEMSFLNNVLSIPFLCLAFFFQADYSVETSTTAFYAMLSSSDYVLFVVIILSPLFALCLSVSAFWVQAEFSPTTMITMNNVNKLPLIAINNIAFAEKTGVNMVVGLLVSTFGAIMYGIETSVGISSLSKKTQRLTIRGAIALAFVFMYIVVQNDAKRTFSETQTNCSIERCHNHVTWVEQELQTCRINKTQSMLMSKQVNDQTSKTLEKCRQSTTRTFEKLQTCRKNNTINLQNLRKHYEVKEHTSLKQCRGNAARTLQELQQCRVVSTQNEQSFLHNTVLGENSISVQIRKQANTLGTDGYSKDVINTLNPPLGFLHSLWSARLKCERNDGTVSDWKTFANEVRKDLMDLHPTIDTSKLSIMNDKQMQALVPYWRNFQFPTFYNADKQFWTNIEKIVKDLRYQFSKSASQNRYIATSKKGLPHFLFGALLSHLEVIFVRASVYNRCPLIRKESPFDSGVRCNCWCGMFRNFDGSTSCEQPHVNNKCEYDYKYKCKGDPVLKNKKGNQAPGIWTFGQGVSSTLPPNGWTLDQFHTALYNILYSPRPWVIAEARAYMIRVGLIPNKYIAVHIRTGDKIFGPASEGRFVPWQVYLDRAVTEAKRRNIKTVFLASDTLAVRDFASKGYPQQVYNVKWIFEDNKVDLAEFKVPDKNVFTDHLIGVRNMEIFSNAAFLIGSTQSYYFTPAFALRGADETSNTADYSRNLVFIHWP